MIEHEDDTDPKDSDSAPGLIVGLGALFAFLLLLVLVSFYFAV